MRRKTNRPEPRQGAKPVGPMLLEMSRMAKVKQRLEFLENCPRLKPLRPAREQFIQEVLLSLELDDLYAIQEVVAARDRGEVFALTDRQAAAYERFDMAEQRKYKLAGHPSLPDSSHGAGK